jgi:hypothetical protein
MSESERWCGFAGDLSRSGFDPRQRTIFPKLQPLGVDRQVRKAVLTSTTDRVYLLVETGVWP